MYKSHVILIVLFWGVPGKCAGEVSEDKACVHHFD